MRKHLFYLLLAIATCIITGCSDNYADEPNQPKTMTHEVTQNEALQHLNKILPDLKIPSTRGAVERSFPQITSSYSIGSHSSTRSDGEVEPYFHIFNFGDNEGFAIMSGDDRVTPLLALTFKGKLTPDTEIDNPGFKIAYEMMEDYYVEQVSTFSFGGDGGGNLPIDPGLDPGLERYYEYSDPVIVSHNMPYGHCQVEWGQEAPYNRYCGPFYQLGFEVYVGCVPVAVAQLMSIYKYPNSYNGYTFNWDLMNQYVNRSYSQQDNAVAIDQIARLMQQLGLPENLDVQYEVVAPGNGSSAYPEDIPHTLRNFGYSSGGSLTNYDTEVVAEELIAGYPVLIGGKDGDAGHRWLGHGIKEFFQTMYVYNGYNILVSTVDIDVKYILCNWGWDGYQDGYYASKVFDTDRGPTDVEALSSTQSTTRYYFRNNLTVVTGIRK